MKYIAIFDLPDGYKMGCAAGKMIKPDGRKTYEDEEFEDVYAQIEPLSEQKAEVFERFNTVTRIMQDLGIANAYDMPSFWCNNRKDYKVIQTKYHQGYMKALEDIENEVRKRFGFSERSNVVDMMPSIFRGGNGMSKEQLSVGNSIKALALINIQDIFSFTITAKDEEIRERYGSEESAVCVAEKYLDIALKTGMLEHALAGWNMNYTMPIKDSDERADYTAYFYNKYKEVEEAPAEPTPKPAEAPAKPGSADTPTTEAPRPKATVKRRIPQETIDKIVELTNRGDSVDDIALKAGVSGPTVRKYQKEVMDCEE